MDKQVELEKITYQNELLNALSECRKYRNEKSKKYPQAVSTLFDIVLTTDRRKKAQEYVKKLIKRYGIDNKYEEVKEIEKIDIREDEKGRVLGKREQELRWDLSDIYLIASRKAMEDFNDFKHGKTSENRGV